MNGDKPSYLTSTTSLLLFVAVIGYVVGNLATLWFSKGEQGFGNLEGLITTLLPLYAVRKGLEEVKKTNGASAPGGTHGGNGGG